MLQCVAVCCNVLQCVAVCCSVLAHLQSPTCLGLWYVAVCCSVMQCVAVCCSVLQCIAVTCSVMQCATVCCSVLQYGAVRCSVLQCVALCRHICVLQCGAKFDLQWILKLKFVGLFCLVSVKRDVRTWAYPQSSPSVSCSVVQRVAVCYSVLQCVTACCSVLQRVAVCYSVLQCVTACCSVLQRIGTSAIINIFHSWRRSDLTYLVLEIYGFPDRSSIGKNVAVWCSVLQCEKRPKDHDNCGYAYTMQHTVVQCNALQHIPTHCNTLQHTALSFCLSSW